MRADPMTAHAGDGRFPASSRMALWTPASAAASGV